VVGEGVKEKEVSKTYAARGAKQNTDGESGKGKMVQLKKLTKKTSNQANTPGWVTSDVNKRITGGRKRMWGAGSRAR